MEIERTVRLSAGIQEAATGGILEVKGGILAFLTKKILTKD
jgi:hypothetical protein